jgi:hypothetical protein
LCFTVDVGRDGFCAEILRVLPPGTEFDGVMDMDGNEVPFRGRILWAHAGAPYLGVRGRMGVRFLGPDLRVQANSLATNRSSISSKSGSKPPR